MTALQESQKQINTDVVRTPDPHPHFAYFIWVALQNPHFSFGLKSESENSPFINPR